MAQLDGRVKVIDDGVGFDPQTRGRPPSKAIWTLQHPGQADFYRRKPRIESTPGSSTVVTAILSAVMDGSEAPRSGRESPHDNGGRRTS